MYKYNSLQIGQLPQQHLSFLLNLLNFIISKYLKQEVDDDLSLCVDEGSPCGFSITGNIKISMGQRLNVPMYNVVFNYFAIKQTQLCSFTLLSSRHGCVQLLCYQIDFLEVNQDNINFLKSNKYRNYCILDMQ